MFMVRFSSMDANNKTMDAGPIFYDRLLVIIKNWSPGLDLKAIDVQVVPTWIKFLGLPLKFWEQNSLNKLAALIGKPIRTHRATAQNDIMEFAMVLVKINMDQDIPNEITFYDECDNLQVQKVVHECKPITCSDYKGV